MNTATFKLSDSISVLLFLNNVKTACDSNSIYEEAAVWFPHFIREPAKEALSCRVTADNKKDT